MQNIMKRLYVWMFMGEVYAIQIQVYDKDAAINILYTYCTYKDYDNKCL